MIPFLPWFFSIVSYWDNKCYFLSFIYGSVNVTNSAKISVLCIKNNVQGIYGKSMNFAPSYGLNKIVSIK